MIPIGRGGYSKVYKAKINDKIYALKEMDKARIIVKESEEAVMRELAIWKRVSELDSKFIINLY